MIVSLIFTFMRTVKLKTKNKKKQKLLFVCKDVMKSLGWLHQFSTQMFSPQ